MARIIERNGKRASCGCLRLGHRKADAILTPHRHQIDRADARWDHAQHAVLAQRRGRERRKIVTQQFCDIRQPGCGLGRDGGGFKRGVGGVHDIGLAEQKASSSDFLRLFEQEPHLCGFADLGA